MIQNPASSGQGDPSFRLIAAALPLAALAALLGGVLVFGPERMTSAGVGMAVILVGLIATLRFGPQLPLLVLLVAGYLSGYVKLRYGSMLGYVVPEGLCLLLVGYAVFGRAGRSLPLPRNAVTGTILALTAWCVLELLNPEAPLIRSLAGLRSWVLYLWLTFAGYEMLKDARQIRQVCIVMLVMSILTALYGIYQWRQGPVALVGHSDVLNDYARNMRFEDASGHRHFRAFSTYVLPSTYGTNMMIGLLVGFVLITARTCPRWLKGLAIVGSPLMAAGILTSGSRGPLVTLLVAAIVVLLLRRLRGAVPVLAVGIGGLSVAVTLTTAAVISRFASGFDPDLLVNKWMVPLQIGLKVGWEYPFGRGLGYTAGVPSLGAFREAARGFNQFNIDSGVGAAAAELGLFGMLLYLGLVAAVAVVPLRVWRRLPEGQMRDDLLVAVMLGLIFAFTCVIAVPHASLPWSVYLWVLLGMLFKAPQLLVAREATPMVELMELPPRVRSADATEPTPPEPR